MKKIIVITVLTLNIFACNRKAELQPDWSIEAKEGSLLLLADSVVLLKENDVFYKIDINTGGKKELKIRKPWSPTTNKTAVSDRTKPINEWQLESKKSSIKLIETYFPEDDCQAPLYKYEVHQIDKNGEKIFKLGDRDRYNVLDFVWQKGNGDLYIIKNSSKGGDTYFLEKYSIN